MAHAMPRSSAFPKAFGQTNDPPVSPKQPIATPITAGAFSFSIGQSPIPQKRQRVSDNSPTPSRPRLAVPHQTPARPSESNESENESEKDVFAATPQRPITSLKALHSPLTRATLADKTAVHKRLTSVLDKGSPFKLSSTNPPHVHGDDRRRIRLGEIPKTPRDDWPTERINREDEGIGVSPRKPRPLKWTGKGPMPPSAQLANALSTATSSLLLFYNPLQRTLFPSAKRPATTPTRPALPNRPPPSPLHYLRSAPLVLRSVGMIGRRTHHGVVIRATIVSEKDSGLADDAPFDEPNEEQEGQNGVHVEAPTNEVILIIQPLPRECPRLGVDPMVVQGKLEEGTTKAWEVGVWPPYSEGSILATETESGSGQEWVTAQTRSQVIFASRYLIAESL